MMTVLQDIPVKLLSASQLAQFQEPHLPDPEVRLLLLLSSLFFRFCARLS
jgi:hypothetical protein